MTDQRDPRMLSLIEISSTLHSTGRSGTTRSSASPTMRAQKLRAGDESATEGLLVSHNVGCDRNILRTYIDQYWQSIRRRRSGCAMSAVSTGRRTGFRSRIFAPACSTRNGAAPQALVDAAVVLPTIPPTASSLFLPDQKQRTGR